jgi:hypothetical protein
MPDSPLLAGDSEWYVVDDGGQPFGRCPDGGETNGWGRDIPVGGTLDPTRGRWAPLPRDPGECDCYVRMAAGGLRLLLNRQGWIFDASASTWQPLPKPDGSVDEAQAVAWLGDRLFVFGGNTYAGTVPAEQSAGAGTLVNDAWIWSPEGP